MAANTLGIPMDMIEVQPTSSVFNLNSTVSGNSITSDMNTYVSISVQWGGAQL